MIKRKKDKKQKKVTEFYFGGMEFLSIALVCLAIAAVFLVISMQSSYQDKYQIMKYGATNLGLNATIEELLQDRNTVYLAELVNRGLMSPMKNPFYDTKYCDTTSSSVRFDGEEPYVTLKCGEYLINDQHLSEEQYKIYKVTEWNDTKKPSDNDSRELFNYKVNSNNGFSEFYEEEMFLYAFNLENSTNYKEVEEIPKKYQVYSKKFYRHKKEVAIIDAK